MASGAEENPLVTADMLRLGKEMDTFVSNLLWNPQDLMQEFRRIVLLYNQGMETQIYQDST